MREDYSFISADISTRRYKQTTKSVSSEIYFFQYGEDTTKAMEIIEEIMS